MTLPLAELLSTITLNDIKDALPVILSLIVIEGLLSVDNALAIAAMARHLANSHDRFMASWQAESEAPAKRAPRKTTRSRT